MPTPSLLQRAKASTPAFKRPDIRPFIPKGQEDAVDRIVAAGMKIMYSPAMKQEVLDAIRADMPVAQKLGENAAGLILTLDRQAPQGLPQEAMFPAGAELMSECAEMLTAAGQPVTQDDWAQGFLHLVAVLGKKMGASDDEIMGAMRAPLEEQGAAEGDEPAEQPDQDEEQPA